MADGRTHMGDNAPMTTSRSPSEGELEGWFDSLRNWGRWGEDDELGTLNLITPAKRQHAAQLVREGITVSCAHPIDYEYATDSHDPPRHFVTASGEGVERSGQPLH